MMFGDENEGGPASEPGWSPEEIYASWTDFYTKSFSSIEFTKLEFAELLTILLFLKIDHEHGQQHNDRLRAANPPVVDPGLGWDSFQDLDGDSLRKQFEQVVRELQKPQAASSLPPGVDPELTTRLAVFRGAKLKDDRHVGQLTSLIKDEIGPRNWAGHRRETGQAYERLLRFCASDIDSNRDAGQILTPRPLLAAIAEVLAIGPDDVVADPAAGTGGALLAAYDRATMTGGAFPFDACIGADEGQNMVRLATMNLLLNTGRRFCDPAPVGKANSLAQAGGVVHRPGPQRPPTVVICNPPFASNAKAPVHRTDLKGTKNVPANFLQHISAGLPIGARAAVFLPESVLGLDFAKTILRTLMQDCDVHTLLRLPPGTFRNGTAKAPIRANVLFFDKKGPRPDGRPVSGPLWDYDARPIAADVFLASGLADFVHACRPGLPRSERMAAPRFEVHLASAVVASSYQLGQLVHGSGEISDGFRPPREIAKEIADQLAEAQSVFDQLANQLP